MKRPLPNRLCSRLIAGNHLVVTSYQPFVAENTGEGGENVGHEVAGDGHRLWSDRVVELSDRSRRLLQLLLNATLPSHH